MERLTLTPRDVEYLVLEASVITPDAVCGKTLEEIAELPVLEGNTKWPLGRFFTITGKVADAAEDQGIVIDGDVPRVKYIGSKMTAGAVLCKGNVGDYCGASYRGDWRGMKGGNIVINGNAGVTLGEYMMGGKITVKGNVGINAGIHMGKGIGAKDPLPTIIIHGDSPGRVGAFMTRGNIYVLGTIAVMMPGFSPDGTEELEIDGVKATFQILNGDHGEKGRGKLFVRT
jgi:formylmethanofuran dehydrogenase subunit C